MNYLEEKIKREGIVYPGNILKIFVLFFSCSTKPLPCFIMLSI